MFRCFAGDSVGVRRVFRPWCETCDTRDTRAIRPPSPSMPPPEPTPGQIERFRRDGFLIVERINASSKRGRRRRVLRGMRHAALPRERRRERARRRRNAARAVVRSAPRTSTNVAARGVRRAPPRRSPRPAAGSAGYERPPGPRGPRGPGGRSGLEPRRVPPPRAACASRPSGRPPAAGEPPRPAPLAPRAPGLPTRALFRRPARSAARNGPRPRG